MFLAAEYANNVFINCPFDEGYFPLFNSIVFTVYDCGFIPRCALEEDNAGDIRIDKIIDIIKQCKYGIHDISKADLDTVTRLARFNMPLELGIFIGAIKFSTDHNHDKKYMIMDSERYRYRNFISDISGQDIRAHNNDTEQIIKNVRHFLSNASRRKTIASPAFYYKRYEDFTAQLPAICKQLNWNPKELTFNDYFTCVQEWANINKY